MEYDHSELIRTIEARKTYIISKLRTAKKQYQTLQSLPPHKIRIQKHGKGFQYYLRDCENVSRGKYIRKSQHGLVQNTIQKEYLAIAIQELEKELSLLEKYMQDCSPNKLAELYSNLPQGRKIMIAPLEITDEEYACKWLDFKYSGKTIPEDAPEFYTDKNERVRSKSEVIIANTLTKYNIPYHYECPIPVNGMGVVYPDFTVLNTRTRKELFWEHFGMMDNEAYREKTFRKLAIYEKNGIYIGDKLIATWESSTQSLDMKSLEQTINKYLK